MVERALWEREVAGSSPVIPMTFIIKSFKHLMKEERMSYEMLLSDLLDSLEKNRLDTSKLNLQEVSDFDDEDQE